MRPRLVTIPISHYGERARWALDACGVEYDEEHHLQFFSWVAAFRHGRRKFLPVLVTSDGVLCDSADIVRWADARARGTLYPADASLRASIEDLEREIAGDYGVETRRLAYEFFFRALDACLPYNAGRAPWHEVQAMSLLRPAARAFATRYLGIEASSLARGRDLVRRTMDAIAARIDDGRPYLFGDRFTAADLAFACMSAPLVAPAEYGVRLPPIELLPEDARRGIEENRAHPAGAFALRLFRERPKPRGRHPRAPWLERARARS